MNEATKNEAETLATELAGMQQECDRNWTDSITNKWTDKHPYYCVCHGTGKVFLFDDSVRVPCDSQEYRDDSGRVRHLHNRGVGREPVEVKDCRGWTASLDFVTWCDAFCEAEHHITDIIVPRQVLRGPRYMIGMERGQYHVSFAWVSSNQGDIWTVPAWCRDAEAVLTALSR